MHSKDWNVIALVEQWLESFRLATTQMSATKQSILLSTHAIFHGLQESLQESTTMARWMTPCTTRGPHVSPVLIESHLYDI